MAKQKKGSSEEQKTYTNEELEAMIESATKKQTQAQRTLDKILEFSEQAIAGYYELMKQKAMLEKELSKYTGVFAEGKFAIKATLTRKENEAKTKQKELGEEITKMEKMVEEKLSDIHSLEQCASAKEEKIQGYQREIDRWSAKLRKRAQNAEKVEPAEPIGPQ